MYIFGTAKNLQGHVDKLFNNRYVENGSKVQY